MSGPLKVTAGMIGAAGKAAADAAVQTANAAKGRGGGRPEELKRACAEFESLFMHCMLKEMRETVPKSGLISGGKAESLYTSMLDAQLAQEIAHSRGIGLSSLFLKQLGGGEPADDTDMGAGKSTQRPAKES